MGMPRIVPILAQNYFTAFINSRIESSDSSCTNVHTQKVYRANHCYNTLTSLESVSTMLEMENNQFRLSTWFGSGCSNAVRVSEIAFKSHGQCVPTGKSFSMVSIHQPPQSHVLAL